MKKGKDTRFLREWSTFDEEETRDYKLSVRKLRWLYNFLH